MALNDIQFTGSERNFILELPNVSYTGRLSDILYEPKSINALINELKMLLAIIEYRRKTR